MSILHSIDLDGTTNTIDMLGALEGRSCPEIQSYLFHAANFVGQQTGISSAKVLKHLRKIILEAVYPQRDQYEHWGSFPSSDKTLVKITPAVDHFMLIRSAIEIYLKAQRQTRRIQQFLATDWAYAVFKSASDSSMQDAQMDPDAIEAIDGLLTRDELAVILTNSDVKKAELMLRKAGFGSRMALESVTPGKIGAIGGARKFEVDVTQPAESVDLSPYFGFPVQLDLRRRRLVETVRGLVEATGADRLCVYTDMPEMEGYPLAKEFGERARHGMKLNPCSVEGSVRAARELIGAVTSDRLSVLVEQLSG